MSKRLASTVGYLKGVTNHLVISRSAAGCRWRLPTLRHEMPARITRISEHAGFVTPEENVQDW